MESNIEQETKEKKKKKKLAYAENVGIWAPRARKGLK